jgi:hypothetical protein
MAVPLRSITAALFVFAGVLTELRDSSFLESGLTEILLINCTEPSFCVGDAGAGDFEAAGLKVLQLENTKSTTDVMGMIFFNIFSTWEDIGMANIANLLPK